MRQPWYRLRRGRITLLVALACSIVALGAVPETASASANGGCTYPGQIMGEMTILAPAPPYFAESIASACTATASRGLWERVEVPDAYVSWVWANVPGATVKQCTVLLNLIDESNNYSHFATHDCTKDMTARASVHYLFPSAVVGCTTGGPWWHGHFYHAEIGWGAEVISGGREYALQSNIVSSPSSEC